jgi:Na+-driven multidrug efflux pump
MPLILKLYALTPETDRYVFILVALHNLFIMTIYPYSGPLSNAMNASGDVRYTMKVSIFATVICRVAFSVILGLWLHMGIIGVWIAMGMDWGIRAMLFVRRFKSGKWKEFRVI